MIFRPTPFFKAFSRILVSGFMALAFSASSFAAEPAMRKRCDVLKAKIEGSFPLFLFSTPSVTSEERQTYFTWCVPSSQGVTLCIRG